MLENESAPWAGNAAYVSPMARAVEGTDVHTLQATFPLSASVDVMTHKMAMLDAVFLSESMDQGNWELLAKFRDAMPDGEARQLIDAAVAEVEPDGDEHLEWARSMNTRMAMLQAQSSAAGAAAMKTEESWWQRSGAGSATEPSTDAGAPGRGVWGRASVGTGGAVTALTRSTVVSCPPERVYGVLADVERLPEFSDMTVAVHNGPGRPVQVGDRFEQVVKLLGRDLESEWHVRALQPPTLLRFEGSAPPGVRATLVERLNPEGDGTRVELDIDYTLPLGILGRVVDAVYLRRKNEQQADEILAKLKSLCEAGP